MRRGRPRCLAACARGCGRRAHPLRNQDGRRSHRGWQTAQGHRPSRCRPGQRRCAGRHPGRRHGRQRADVQHHLGCRACRWPDAGLRAQHRPRQRVAQGWCLEAQQVRWRRAARQDGGDRRPRAHRGPRGRAAQGLWRQHHRLRPVHHTDQGSSAGSAPCRARRAARDVRLHHRAPAQDARDGGPAGQRRPWPRSSRRSTSSTRPAAASSTRRRWPRQSTRAGWPEPESTSLPRSHVPTRHCSRWTRSSSPRIWALRRTRLRRRPASRWPSRCAWPSAASSCRTPSTSPAA